MFGICARYIRTANLLPAYHFIFLLIRVFEVENSSYDVYCAVQGIIRDVYEIHWCTFSDHDGNLIFVDLYDFYSSNNKPIKGILS